VISKRSGPAGTFVTRHPRRLPHRGPRANKTPLARKIEPSAFLSLSVRPASPFNYLGTRVNRQRGMLMKDGKQAANMFDAARSGRQGAGQGYRQESD